MCSTNVQYNVIIQNTDKYSPYLLHMYVRNHGATYCNCVIVPIYNVMNHGAKTATVWHHDTYVRNHGAVSANVWHYNTRMLGITAQSMQLWDSTTIQCHESRRKACKRVARTSMLGITGQSKCLAPRRVSGITAQCLQMFSTTTLVC